MPRGRMQAAAAHIPGEPGIWLFIGGDIVLFSVLFVTFLDYRAADPVLFGAGRGHLNQLLGLLNTLLMLTSSWFVASGVEAARRRMAGVPQFCFGVALSCGAGFGVVKYFEYAAKVSAGITPTTDDFFMFYFVYTGIHMIHVLIGMAVLWALIGYTRSRPIEAVNVQHLETGASFWHLVDLLWIVLFALLYLAA
ncbi:cytochrome c oxidase subunit 3 family protein [Oleomonas cavernae]|uniref:Cytochrome c oxidase subunit 3 family protein n=1 Tax=Oleomonas cavernae TaxID=2320859 RepID=A0A418WH88_9PROT|nr:cytochrome c oxidase subunit 3 [Oleomonas cavernae]RJF89406.1 cytochrome c oxidase subunit 3 family protein [Oleomonas cavernae]